MTVIVATAPSSKISSKIRGKGEPLREVVFCKSISSLRFYGSKRNGALIELFLAVSALIDTALPGMPFAIVREVSGMPGDCQRNRPTKRMG